LKGIWALLPTNPSTPFLQNKAVTCLLEVVLDYITPLDHTCYTKMIMPGILLIKITMALLCAVELYQCMLVENWALCKNLGTETKLKFAVRILTKLTRSSGSPSTRLK